MDPKHVQKEFLSKRWRKQHQIIFKRTDATSVPLILLILLHLLFNSLFLFSKRMNTKKHGSIFLKNLLFMFKWRIKDLSLHYTIIELRNLLNRMSFFFTHSLFVISSFPQCLYNNLIFWANLKVYFSLFKLENSRKRNLFQIYLKFWPTGRIPHIHIEVKWKWESSILLMRK